MAKDSAAPFGDDGTTAELYRRRARNPLAPRAAVEELLASMNRIIEITEPDPALPAALNFSQSRRAALAAKRGIEKGLAQRDAADRVEPRRRELPHRLETALQAIGDCISGMGALDRQRSAIETDARNEGFVVDADGCVSISPEHGHPQEAGDDTAARRARYEHRLMSVLAEMARLQEHTVATISERLGADEPGIPWAFVECAREGLELTLFESGGAGLPPSPLRDLLERLTAEMARAKQRFGARRPARSNEDR
ncbi:hypothetical protein [Mycobacterium lacus]|uniref:Uncharacterized protein n=1 Tax=Mycobacterium lacus TaxID=169765 RepID=A0A1X1XMB7_9MYCO|nr:hypothetical protein [Mycobacterium lacus]MCV7121780.1 hypothetical protein [Mycobacterium lacus]ORV99868.1 hypothetical protein AWC15_09905 [Mycobacterium lacus]BBX97258.1 hypothetical protein MLAC_25520 [Mycobacterium lacus]